ncbi:hypothetical protein QJS10_CPA03g00458 [Acorus calamus]|uniref:Uncharacterized protein n=1 Tax=Acorus calamus TaxID=4465 RepID=A0AAV9F8Y3_ACOCL|nr:hypothetical protein QJS10_CPA03g00458 [Acorus calamus]
MASMSSITYAFFYHTKCTSARERKNLPIKINGTSTIPPTPKIMTSSAFNSVAPVLAPPTIQLERDRTRQNIPTKKQIVDPFRQGLITQGGVGYTQTVVIRSYEVGADKTATLESILNLLQV